jgi:cobalamin biosynthetic protein CobC
VEKTLPADDSLSHVVEKVHMEDEHGGNIVSASEQYDISLDKWVDLSTGINPKPYPVELDVASFQRLPYLRPEFIAASTDYYQSSHFLPVTGTQAAIQQLPNLLADFPVLIPQVGYQEHAKYWQRKGSDIDFYPSSIKSVTLTFIDKALTDNPERHVVIINPNNPTGVLFEKEQLLSWARQLAPQAYLIVDEAFIDTAIEHSVLNQSLADNIIVLRSFGKFFGLAGIRLGYCFANESILAGLQHRLGLWQINGPAQAIAIKALQDKVWQSQAKQNIQDNAKFTRRIFNALMSQLSLDAQSVFHSDLFSSYKISSQCAVELKEYFAQSGMLLRVIEIEHEKRSEMESEISSNVRNERGDKPALLRIGLLDECDQLTVKRVITVVRSAEQLFSERFLFNINKNNHKVVL